MLLKFACNSGDCRYEKGVTFCFTLHQTKRFETETHKQCIDSRGASPYRWLDYNFKNEAQERFFMDHHCTRIFANTLVAPCLAAMQPSNPIAGLHHQRQQQEPTAPLIRRRRSVCCSVATSLSIVIDDASNVKAIARSIFRDKNG
jgi:hypothetical protein